MNDRADVKTAATAAGLIGHLQHTQDHRLTTDEQRALTRARGVLQDLIIRIKAGVE